MEEMLVVLGVVALVGWWVHSGSAEPPPQPAPPAATQPANPPTPPASVPDNKP
jgi:hypothetical protein